jgi:hypothetical protein
MRVSAYRTVADGSSTSSPATADRAAEVATESAAEPAIVCADLPRAAVAEHAVDLPAACTGAWGKLSGRLLGSAPSEVAPRSGFDVLIVRTT